MKEIVNSSVNKYSPFKVIALDDRTWPTKQIIKSPIWCSVDLRDGNQSLIEPMGMEKKLRFFSMLVDLGFKEIEIGFPSASNTEFSFVRELIEKKLIPDDVKIQVLTQAREHLIKRTFESVKGAENVILHLYNSTSTLQREVVFKQDKKGILKIATDGAKLVKILADENKSTNWQFEYSPESFTGTELEYAVEVCNEVNQIWKPVWNKLAPHKMWYSGKGKASLSQRLRENTEYIKSCAHTVQCSLDLHMTPKQSQSDPSYL